MTTIASTFSGSERPLDATNCAVAGGRAWRGAGVGLFEGFGLGGGEAEGDGGVAAGTLARAADRGGGARAAGGGDGGGVEGTKPTYPASAVTWIGYHRAN
jgi:hypothetical protein